MEETPAHPQSPGWLQRIIIGHNPRRTAIRIGALVLICFVTFRFILLPIRIDGISMLPTYHTGQINFVNRLAFIGHEPQRGDIISVRLSAGDGLSNPSVMYMKRIIALPGETLSFQAGRAFINGQPLDEPYLKLPCDWNHASIMCGADQFYCVGDNRSMPFNQHTQGRVRRDHIVGKLLL